MPLKSLKINIKDNGKPIKRMVLVKWLMLAKVCITVTGKIILETARALWPMSTMMYTPVTGKMETSTVKAHMFSLKLEWNSLGNGTIVKFHRVSGNTLTEPSSQENSITISLREKVNGNSRMAM